MMMMMSLRMIHVHTTKQRTEERKKKKVGVGKGLAVRMKKKTVSAIETNATRPSPKNLRLIGTRSLKLRFQVHGLETTVDICDCRGRIVSAMRCIDFQ